MSTRRFWQIHLSTAVVLMLVASVLLWHNVRRNGFGRIETLGWPVSYSTRNITENFDSLYWSQANFVSITINSVVGIIILVLIACLFEYLLRHQELSNRRLWQIHLSTVVMITVMAGVWLWLNMRPVPDLNFELVTRGYPYVMNRGGKGWAASYTWAINEDSFFTTNVDVLPPTGIEGIWYIFPMLLNAAVGCVAVAFLVLFSEFRIRRREARKP